MKKTVLTLFCILFINGAGYCAESISGQIEKLEKNYFGYDYKGETTAQRLERLEKAVYGTSFKDNSQKRIQRLQRDMPQYASAAPVSEVSEADYEQIPQEAADSDVKYPVVDKIEQKVFNKAYSGEDIYKRLSRLEKQVYKKESNASLNDRVDSLRASVLANARIMDDSSVVLEEYDPGFSGAAADMNSFSDESRYNYYTPQNTKNRIAGPDYHFRSDNSSADLYDLDMLEKEVFGQKYSNEPAKMRLARLENAVFQKNFSGSEDARIQRLLATTTAKKTAKYYDNNKLMQHLNTGIQIGGIILMVLAMIL